MRSAAERSMVSGSMTFCPTMAQRIALPCFDWENRLATSDFSRGEALASSGLVNACAFFVSVRASAWRASARRSKGSNVSLASLMNLVWYFFGLTDCAARSSRAWSGSSPRTSISAILKRLTAWRPMAVVSGFLSSCSTSGLSIRERSGDWTRDWFASAWATRCSALARF